jgi:pimeloyl-ACP methyl ester carboxylesterase
MTPNVVRANEVDFAYFEAGQGPLVLCLHGFPDTAWSFVPVLNRLAAGGYHAVAPFMRGYPPSELGPGGDYRIITLGRDALALIEALGAQRAFLVGHDWGAVAAYIAAALAPERIERMVTAALPHLHRFLFWPSLRQLKRSRYMGFPAKEDWPLCNLYSVTRGQQAIRELAGAMRDRTGNLPPLYGIFPDYSAPILPEDACPIWRESV